MIENNSQQTAKVFIFIFILLGAIVFGFWQTAKKNTYLQTVQVIIPEKNNSVAGLSFVDDKVMKIKIDSTEVIAEIAQSDQKKKIGLGMRKSIDAGTGMLFVFNNPGPCPNACGFWNKDMLFPIDIIWIYDDEVVDVYEHLPSYAEVKDFTVSPKNKVNFVLEVPDGFIKSHNINIGNKVIYEPEKN